MNLSMGGILFMAVVILLSEGCGAHKRFPESSLTGGVYELKIDNALTPQSVTAKRGDEISQRILDISSGHRSMKTLWWRRCGPTNSPAFASLFQGSMCTPCGKIRR